MRIFRPLFIESTWWTRPHFISGVIGVKTGSASNHKPHKSFATSGESVGERRYRVTREKTAFEQALSAWIYDDTFQAMEEDVKKGHRKRCPSSRKYSGFLYISWRTMMPECDGNAGAASIYLSPHTPPFTFHLTQHHPRSLGRPPERRWWHNPCSPAMFPRFVLQACSPRAVWKPVDPGVLRPLCS